MLDPRVIVRLRLVLFASLLAAVSIGCSRDPVRDEEPVVQAPKSPQDFPFLCFPSQQGAPGCRCQGQEWFPTCESDFPTSPNATYTILCTPNSVARGDTVSCSIRLDRFHTPGDTSEFLARVVLPDSAGKYTSADSAYMIAFAFEDGIVTDTNNVWSWTIRGPAVTTSSFRIYMAVDDSAGASYWAKGSSGFQVSSYPYEADLAIEEAVSLTSTWGDTLMADGVTRRSDGSSEFKTYWGRTYHPMIDDGVSTAEKWTQYATGWDTSYDSTSVPIDTALSGPNRGLRYLAFPVEFTAPISIYAKNLLGTTDWASLQDGSGQPISGYNRCDRFATPTLFTTLAIAVKKHEGSIAGGESHVDIYKSKADDPPMVRLGRQMQRAWFREWDDMPTFGGIRDVLSTQVSSLGQNEHSALDTEFWTFSNTSAIANCYWVFPN